MKTTKIQKGLLLLALAAGTCAIGCELIVDFDRTRIPVDTSDVLVPDAIAPVDATTADVVDSGNPDVTTTDAGSDAADSGDLDAADAAD